MDGRAGEFVVLLRGVNVGGAKRVPMARFRELLVDLGFTGVATLLNSGNAVYRAATGTPKAHAERIGAALREKLGVDVSVIVKTAKTLEAIVTSNPIASKDLEHSRFLVAFTQEAGDLAALAPAAKSIVPPERFAIGKDAAYLYCANGILQSKAGSALLGKLGAKITSRNLATTLKLLALAESERPT
jgi:uncharacterized protein (DUF1697 family)